jgi:hypothetical protein
MMHSTPEMKVKMRLWRAKCPNRQQNSPTKRRRVARIKNKADLVTASERTNPQVLRAVRKSLELIQWYD